MASKVPFHVPFLSESKYIVWDDLNTLVRVAARPKA